MTHSDRQSVALGDPLAWLGRTLNDPLLAPLTGDRMQYCQVNTMGQIDCPSRGVTLILAGDRVKKVQLYVNVQGYFRPFPGRLPGSIESADTRSGVAAKLGRPESAAGPLDVHASGALTYWVLYHVAPSPLAGRIRRIDFSRTR